APPFLDADDIESLSVWEAGRLVASAPPRSDRLSEVEFLARGREGYELEVCIPEARRQQLRDELGMGRNADLWAPAAARYEEAPEEARPDLLRLRRPQLLRQQVAEPGRLTDGDEW